MKYFYLAQKLASLDISQLSIQSISAKYVDLPPEECPPPWPGFDASLSLCWRLLMMEIQEVHMLQAQAY